MALENTGMVCVFRFRDVPIHHLHRPSHSGFDDGSPDGNDPLVLARQMASRGITLVFLLRSQSAPYVFLILPSAVFRGLRTSAKQLLGMSPLRPRSLLRCCLNTFLSFSMRRIFSRHSSTSHPGSCFR